MGKIFNDVPNFSFKDESENIDSLIFIKPKIINKRNISFKTELLKKREEKKGTKNLKKLNIPQAILIML